METLKLDLIDQLAGLSAGDSVHKLRHWRDKVALATEGSYAGIFGANRNGNGNDNGHMYLAGLTLAERLLVAFYICVLTPSPALAKHYLRRITSLNEKPLPAALDALRADNLTAIEGTRLKAILGFARTLTLTPISGDKALLHSLPAAGLDTPSVVALAQLIAFLSYQIRLLAGVQAMAWLQASNEPARDERAQDQGTNDNQAQGHNTSISFPKKSGSDSSQ